MDSYKFADEDNNIKPTLSIGIRFQHLHEHYFSDFYAKADQAMYKSKRLGRNQASNF